MRFHYTEGSDGSRHLHKADCGELKAQLAAEEVWEFELPDDATEDEVLAEIWADFEPTAEDLDSYADMTVFRRCADELLPPEEDGDERYSGNPKADAFMDEAETAGWAVDFEILEEYVNVKARREYIDLTDGLRHEQILDLTWTPTRLLEANHLSGLPGQLAKVVGSVKGARDILTGPVPRRQVSAAKVEREEAVKRIPKEILPFDIEEAYDDEILDACRGRTLVWRNDTSENYESATVIGKNPKHYKIETGAAGRAILSFVSIEGGFRSVALENLVQVK